MSTADLIATVHDIPSGVIGVICMIGLLAGQHMQRKRDRQTQGQLSTVEEHVANTHTTNLREDLDGKADKDDVVQVRADIHDLKVELQDFIKEERVVRRDVVRRLTVQERIADQHHPGDV